MIQQHGYDYIKFLLSQCHCIFSVVLNVYNFVLLFSCLFNSDIFHYHCFPFPQQCIISINIEYIQIGISLLGCLMRTIEIIAVFIHRLGFSFFQSVVNYPLLVRAVLFLIYLITYNMNHLKRVKLIFHQLFSAHYRLDFLLKYIIYCLSQQCAHSCQSSRMYVCTCFILVNV